MIRNYFMAALCCALPAAFECSNPAVAGNGGSSTTVNAQVFFTDATVRITTQDRATSGLALLVCSPAYRPYENSGYVDSVTAVASDTLSWNAPSQGTYCLFITAKPSGSAFFMRNISLTKGTIDTVRCVCGPCHNLTGRVETRDTANGYGLYALSFYGSPFYAVTDSSRRFAINNVPSGGYTLSVRPTAKQLFRNTVEYPIITDSLGSTAIFRVIMP